jgi:4-amino-4-deoxy-L-arabinose transferase-like glycosyltransferase
MAFYPPAARRLGPLAVPALLAALVLVGLGLRLAHLERRTMSHVESYVPGLDLPGWAYPPPRHTLGAVLRTTVHHDGHPPAYFVAMLGWTSLFGTSLTACRLPSALLGALSIALVFAVACREADRRAALVAAGLLALNGHHLYWSQMARMYAPAAFLGLLSTWLLWRVLDGGGWRARAAYVLVGASMLWTQMYCWPLLFAQILWSTGRALWRRSFPVALRLQVAIVIAGFPAVSLAVHQNPPTRFFEPVLEYLQFGYLFSSLAPHWEGRPTPIAPGYALALFAVALIALGLAVPGRPGRSGDESEDAPPDGRELDPTRAAPSDRLLFAAAFAVALAMAVFAAWSPVARRALYALVPLPPLCVVALLLVERRWPAVAARTPLAARRVLAALRAPSLWLATIPVLCMAGASCLRPSFVARGTLVFSPFLLIAIARGLGALSRARVVGPIAVLAVLVVHVDSVRYAFRAESDPRDYAGLAEALQRELEPDDLVFVTGEYYDTPLLYYLTADRAQLVHEGYADALQQRGGRAWVVWFDPPEAEPPAAMLAAVEGMAAVNEVHVHGGHARLYRVQV